jgi:filamentous hemagglutinin
VIKTLKSGSALQLVLALGVSMQGWSAAEAQTVTNPPVVVSGKGTSLDITPSGTPIINIAAPGIGASYNSFSRLDVGPEGLIFNNSGGISPSVIAGQILANPNLRPVTSKGKTTYPTPANLIIAEVLNGSPSNLRGPIEIAGWKAGLVIANPAGITCDGCGFINVSRATLTTGVPTRDGYNRLTGIQVNGGSVEVQGRGMSGSTLDFFDIVAGTAKINADIYAREILIAGGTGSFDYYNNTSTAGGSNTGQLAIDSTVLGGMYANRIRLLGTGAGMGINLRGVVSALDRQVTIAADGNINLRRVDAGGDVTIRFVLKNKFRAVAPRSSTRPPVSRSLTTKMLSMKLQRLSTFFDRPAAQSTLNLMSRMVNIATDPCRRGQAHVKRAASVRLHSLEPQLMRWAASSSLRAAISISSNAVQSVGTRSA